MLNEMLLIEKQNVSLIETDCIPWRYRLFSIAKQQQKRGIRRLQIREKDDKKRA